MENFDKASSNVFDRLVIFYDLDRRYLNKYKHYPLRSGPLDPSNFQKLNSYIKIISQLIPVLEKINEELSQELEEFEN